MRTVLITLTLAGLAAPGLYSAQSDTTSPPSPSKATTQTHHKQAKKHPKHTAAAEDKVGTKGFPPKPLPSADPRNPADPQKSPVNQRTPAAEAPVKPPDAR